MNILRKPKINIHKFIRIGILVACLINTLITANIFLPAPRVEAADYDPDELSNAYNVGWALSDCAGEFLAPRKSTTEINEGDFFGTGVIEVGYLIEPDDGQMRCGTQEEIKKLFDAIGESPEDVLTGAGVYKADGQTVYYVRTNKSKEDSAKAIRKYIGDKFGFTFPGSFKDPMSKPAQYAAAKAAFDTKCKGPPRGSGKEVKVVNAQGDFERNDAGEIQHYKLNLGENDVISVGYGLFRDKGEDQKMSCFTVADVMNDTADAYAAVVKARLNNSDPSDDINPDENTAADKETCESLGGVQSWFMCPAIEAIGGALNWVDTQLVRLLEIDQTAYDSNELYQVWATFRNIGLSLLVVAMLVMVISTALGLGILDAYTIKKAMPRLIAAAIFMLLSWWICIFLIYISNLIGSGVLGLMTAPFDGINSNMAELFRPSAAGSAIQFGGIAIAVTAVVAFPQVLTILGTWLGMALLVVGLALIVLVARQMFILVAIILSPIAIVSWIFPGNDKLWKLWWQTFSKLLIMFPMIMALIASGRIFAHIIDIDPAQNNAFGVILKITAYVIPYAFIPLTFKVAGGVFGNLAGMVNDRGKGGFDRLRKKRQEATQQLGRNVKGGVGARGNQQNFLNRSTSAIASGPKGWRPGKRGADHRAASRNTGAMLAGQAQLEANKTHQMHKNNDAYQLALADEGLAQTKINEARQDYDVAEKAGDVEKMRNAKANIANREGALAAARSIPHKTNATRRQAALELASTGYQFSAGRKGYSELSAIADSVSGGDAAARAEFMDNAQFNLKQAGRYDLGGINHGAGYDFKSSISKASGYQAGNAKPETHRTGAAELLGQEFMTEDGKTLEAPEFAATLHAKAASGALNVEDFKLHHRNLIDAYNGATGANREEIGKQLSAIEALNNGPTPADEAGVNRILNLQQVVQANQQEAYRNQPLSRAQIDANNNPPQPGGPV